ncbi:hypothetical protein HZQ32_11040 [Elizabethkingia anophelis]|nr:hypothetical protein [Elizabethkingia anophelis]MDV4143099.1 hypothetical protein [Elizabethkingia anophelis]
MKKLFIFLFALFVINVFSQEGGIEYEGGEIYIVAQDGETKSVLYEKPYGKISFLRYDKFYKSYIIFIQMQEGRTMLKFDFLKQMSDGKGIIAHDPSKPNELYGIYDNLDYNGTMAIIYMERIAGNILSYKIVNAVGENKVASKEDVFNYSPPQRIEKKITPQKELDSVRPYYSGMVEVYTNVELYDVPDMINGKVIYSVQSGKVKILERVKEGKYYKVNANGHIGYIGLISIKE